MIHGNSWVSDAELEKQARKSSTSAPLFLGDLGRPLLDVLRQIRVDEVVPGVAVWAVCGSCLFHEPQGKFWWRIWYYSGGVGVGRHSDCGSYPQIFYFSIVLTTSTDAN